MKTNIEKIPTNRLISELNKRLAAKVKEVNTLKSEIENVITTETSSAKLTPKTQVVRKTRKTKAKTSSTTAKTATKETTNSLPNMITEVLTNHQNGLHIKEVLTELEKTDWQTTSTNKYNLVGVALASNKERFEKVSRGVYRLKTQQQNG